MSPERRVRERPRISAPKMGEYLTAAAARRERLLLDQRFPPTFKQIWYRDAENAIQAALISGDDVVTRLIESARLLGTHVATTRFRNSAKRCCSQAIRRLALLFPQIPTRDARFRCPGQISFFLTVEGVLISIRPLALSRRNVKGNIRSGGVLAVFRKGEALSERGAKAVAELLRRALEDSGLESVHPSDCVVVDVFSGEIYSASTRGKRISSDIASACREIAVRWPALATSQAA